MRIKLLFLSQQRLLRESLERVLAMPDIDFLPPVSNTEQAIESIRNSQPDVVLIDLDPALFGIRVVKALKQGCPPSRILILSSHNDSIARDQLALAGIHGFLSKNIGVQDLLWAIHQTSQGRTVVCEKNTCSLRDSLPVNGYRGVTSRETEVLELIARGLANKQVAAELGISIKTVQKHRQRLMSKLEAHETAGLTWRAFCLGIGQRSQN